MVFKILNVTFSVPEKVNNSIFEMSIITKTLNVNNLRTASPKFINLHTIIKCVEYYLNNFQGKDNVYSDRFWDMTVRM